MKEPPHGMHWTSGHAALPARSPSCWGMLRRGTGPPNLPLGVGLEKANKTTTQYVDLAQYVEYVVLYETPETWLTCHDLPS